MVTERRPAATFPRHTVGELADALGVHRNTVTAWAREGAPAGPPFCELQWRTWAAAGGRSVPTAPEQALLELLAGAGVADYRRMLERQTASAAPAAAAPGAAAPPPGMGSLDWGQENKRLDAVQKQRALDLQERRLISIDDLHRLVEAIASVGATVFDGAGGLADALPLSPDDRERVRAVLIEQLAHRRADLVAGLRSQMQTFLERKE